MQVYSILHDLNLAGLYADRIAVLQSGQLIALDKPDRVLKKELTQQVFGFLSSTKLGLSTGYTEADRQS